MITEDNRLHKGDQFGGQRLTLDRILRGIIYIFIVWIALVAIVNVKFMGLPAFSVYFLCMSFAIVLIILSVRLQRLAMVWVLFLTIVAIITSILRGWAIVSSIFNALLYAVPLVFIYLPGYVRINLDELCKWIQRLVFVAGVISIMIYMGVLDSGLKLNLSIVKVDNTIGLLGITVGLYLLSQNKKMTSAIVTLIMGVIIILTGQSRARFLLGAVVVFLYVLHVAWTRNLKARSFFYIILLGVAGFYLASKYANTLENYLGFISDKFSEIGEDASSVYRREEMKIHLNLLKENWLTGIGCGALNNSYRTAVDDIFYGHNMFTAALAMNGLFYGVTMLWIVLKTSVQTLKHYWQGKTNADFLAVAFCVQILVLCVTSAGFTKYSTHVMMLCVGVVLQQHRVDKNKKLVES